MKARDQRLAEVIVRAVAASGVSPGTVALAKRLVERWDAPKEERAPAPEKAPIPSVEHHAKVRRQEELDEEKVGIATMLLIRNRTSVDHRGRLVCEACHHERHLEPHHLEMGSGNRRDAPEVVMLLCAACHRTGQHAAHRRVRWFAQNVVIPWAKAHGYPLPSRKEYR